MPEKLHSVTYKGDHSWERTSEYLIAGRQVRVRIDRDAYDFQSSAYAELFDGDQWHRVADIPFSRMAVTVRGERALDHTPVPIVSYVTRSLDTVALQAFDYDERTLLDRVCELLGDSTNLTPTAGEQWLAVHVQDGGNQVAVYGPFPGSLEAEQWADAAALPVADSSPRSFTYFARLRHPSELDYAAKEAPMNLSR